MVEGKASAKVLRHKARVSLTCWGKSKGQEAEAVNWSRCRHKKGRRERDTRETPKILN